MPRTCCWYPPLCAVLVSARFGSDRRRAHDMDARSRKCEIAWNNRVPGAFEVLPLPNCVACASSWLQRGIRERRVSHAVRKQTAFTFVPPDTLMWRSAYDRGELLVRLFCPHMMPWSLFNSAQRRSFNLSDKKAAKHQSSYGCGYDAIVPEANNASLRRYLQYKPSVFRRQLSVAPTRRPADDIENFENASLCSVPIARHEKVHFTKSEGARQNRSPVLTVRSSWRQDRDRQGLCHSGESAIRISASPNLVTNSSVDSCRPVRQSDSLDHLRPVKHHNRVTYCSSLQFPDLLNDCVKIAGSSSNTYRSTLSKHIVCSCPEKDLDWKCKPLKLWTTNDVIAWLQHIGMDEVASVFIAQLGIEDPQTQSYLLKELAALKNEEKSNTFGKRINKRRTKLFPLVSEFPASNIMALTLPKFFNCWDITVASSPIDGSLRITNCRRDDLPLRVGDM
ncbi:unnamed protein product [Soboliphyme baturini]|uniref:SAM domain-containing protein n=1 Tax=Soboliphyme baturini TaxID=241478 RepID=A0A183IE96_9BILA|nr:unnamed protein product [Soboliphyme baturini]